MDSMILRKRLPYEEFDYQQLLDCLAGYKHPRAKIGDLLGKGMIVRVKKGLYVFGEDYRRGPVSREILANLIYGPSYLSLDYVLAHHGLIPERVEELSSVTTGRSRLFETPMGCFSYRRLSVPKFRWGMTRVLLPDGRAYLIASPEKALVDKLILDRQGGLRTQRDLLTHLVENLRIAPENLARLNADFVAGFAERAKSRRARLLAQVLRRLRKTIQEGS